MVSTKSDFEQRKDEIDEYFSFLETLNNENVSLNYSDINGIQNIQISQKLHKIFIANTFLLLYNITGMVLLFFDFSVMVY